jgi:predicted nucleic acid-binding protein
MKHLALDSQAIIDAERRAPHMLEALARWKADGIRLSVSAVAMAEWCVGWHAVKDPARKARASQFFASFLDLLPVIHVVKRDAVLTGEVMGLLKSKGITLDLADALIGCQSLRRGRAVVTANTAHFSHIPGLEVLDPKEKAPAGDGEGHEG